MTVYRGPAEVRGKYAPPFTEPKASESAERKQGGNPVLGRPATAGTLKRKLRLVDTAVPVEVGVKTPTRKSVVAEAKNRPRSAFVGRGRTRGLADTFHAVNQTTFEEKEVEPVSKLDSTALPEAVSPTADSPQPQAPAEEPLQEPIEDRPITGNTWKTTSTQRKYIEELERLLREERKRRVMAEARLQT